MKLIGRFKKALAALLICAVFLTSSFSHQAHADTLTGIAVAGALKMLESIFYSVSVARSGLRSNKSSDDLISAIHSAEDAVANVSGAVLTLDPMTITWSLSNALYNRVSYAFTQNAFNDYLAGQEKTAGQATDEDLGDYIETIGIGTMVDGVVNLSNAFVNAFANWIAEHRSTISGTVVDPAAEYPNYPDLYFDVSGVTYTTSITRILAELGIDKGYTVAQVFDYSQFVIPEGIRSYLTNFNDFDLSTEPFIISISGNSCVIFRVSDNSIILRNPDGRIIDIINSDDFMFKYNNYYYGAEYIYNSMFGYSKSSLSYNTYCRGDTYYELVSFFNRAFQMYVYPEVTPENYDYRGYPAHAHPVDYFSYSYWNRYFPKQYGIPLGYLSYPTCYFINFDNMDNTFVLNMDSSYKLPGSNQDYFTDTYLLALLMTGLGSILSYSLIKGTALSTTISQGVTSSDEEEGSPAYTPPWVILDSGNDIPVDLSKADEVNDIFENQGSSDAMSTAFNTSLSNMVEGLEDLVYRTSTIYKLLATFSSSILAIPALLQAIITGVGGLAEAFGDEIGQWVIDGETGDNYLSHLIPIDDIAAGMAAIPGYFIDEDTEEPFGAQIAAGTEGVVRALGVEEGADSISGLLGRIADALDPAAVEEEEEEGEVPLTIPRAISAAVTLDPGGNPRNTNNVTNLMLLPLLFIFILLMVLFLLLKALAFVVMIFRTPASTAFINSGMITGINWLKTTYLTSSGGSLDLENGTATAASDVTGLFSGISLWAFLIFLVDLVAIFAIVKVAKRWADRQHGE